MGWAEFWTSVAWRLASLSLYFSHFKIPPQSVQADPSWSYFQSLPQPQDGEPVVTISYIIANWVGRSLVRDHSYIISIINSTTLSSVKSFSFRCQILLKTSRFKCLDNSLLNCIHCWIVKFNWGSTQIYPVLRENMLDWSVGLKNNKMHRFQAWKSSPCLLGIAMWTSFLGQTVLVCFG